MLKLSRRPSRPRWLGRSGTTAADLCSFPKYWGCFFLEHSFVVFLIWSFFFLFCLVGVVFLLCFFKVMLVGSCSLVSFFPSSRPSLGVFIDSTCFPRYPKSAPRTCKNCWLTWPPSLATSLQRSTLSTRIRSLGFKRRK